MNLKPDYDCVVENLAARSCVEREKISIENYSRLLIENPAKSGGAVSNLSSIYRARTLLNWIDSKDLDATKKLAYLASLCRRIQGQFDSDDSLAYGFQRMFTLLLSDHPDLTQWYAWHIFPFCSKAKRTSPHFEQPSKPHFHTFNCHLALVGEFEWLDRRSDEALEEGINLKAGKSYKYDFLFFKALAAGNKKEMEENIHQLLKGHALRTRNREHGFAFQESYISSWGFMLAKLAYRHGYELDIDSPWVPSEWLPVRPLESYESGIDFIDEFDIFKPFEKGSHYYENAIEMSPPRDVSNLTFKDWVNRLKWAYP